MGKRKKQELFVEEWVALAEQRINIPVKICLHGSSMEPLIKREKDIITIVPIQSMDRELLRGDIVLFRRSELDYVVHRIYKVSDNGKMVQTWGDNCKFPDSSISKDNVLGIVIALKKRNRKTISLDTAEQRRKGIQWQEGRYLRKCYYLYRLLQDKIVYKCMGIKHQIEKKYE